MKVLTFSRFFPKGHPKEGQPTHFVEKIEACLADIIPGWKMSKTFTLHEWEPYYNCVLPKGHTIRSGNRWKVGDMASLRVWSDKPYRSKQAEFAQVEIKKVWKFEITKDAYLLDGIELGYHSLKAVAENDGLLIDDFECWFAVHPKKTETFSGQVICWNENINY